jgi:transposase-like protein
MRDVSLQSLFVEIEARYGKEEAEYLRKFYQGISGSYHAIALLKEAEMRGEKLSIREAARRSGVSHVAVLELIKKERERKRKSSPETS